MNKDQFEGNWKQLKGKVQQQWGKLTDDQVDVIEGRREELAGKIQEAYGISKSEAEEQISDWEKKHWYKMPLTYQSIGIPSTQL